MLCPDTTAKLQNAETNFQKLIELKFCCGLYFSQEMFFIVSETYMLYLSAKNKMEPNVGVIKLTKKKKLQDMNQCKIPAYHTVRHSSIRVSWHNLASTFAICICKPTNWAIQSILCTGSSIILPTIPGSLLSAVSSIEYVPLSYRNNRLQFKSTKEVSGTVSLSLPNLMRSVVSS